MQGFFTTFVILIKKIWKEKKKINDTVLSVKKK